MKWKHWKPAVVIVLVGVVLCVAVYTAQADKEEEIERKVTEAEVPAAALATLKNLAASAKITEFAEEIEHGHTFYEGSWKAPSGGNVDVLVTPTGDLVEIEELVGADQVPAAVLAAAQKAADKDAQLAFEKKTMLLYEVKFQKGSQQHELLLTPDGHRVEEEDDEDDEDEDEEVVLIDEVPEAVKATILKHAEGGKIQEIERGNEDGKVIYEAEVLIGDKEIELKIDPSGKLLRKEMQDEDDDDDEGDDDRKPTEQQPLTLAVARDSTAILSQLRFLRWLLFFASAAVILLSVLVAALTVRQGLRPLTAIADEIAAVRENDLATRVGNEDVPGELLPIKDRLNELLCRLEDAFKRERRFTADVAHELRTPLAGIRSTLEVTLTRIRDVNEYQASLSECLAISKNMQRMMDNLLTLARLDTQQITFRRVRIELAELVSSCWLSFSDRALERQIIFENSVPLEMTFESDPDNLSMVMSNILDNAVEYADKGGHIWLTARRTNDSIEITISNTGCKLTSEKATQVFDGFWRGDVSRANTGDHFGLGLSLVQRIVRALGGSVTAELQDGGIFTVRLTFPNKNMSK